MAQPTANTRTVHAVCTHDCPDSCGVLVTVDEATGRAVKVAGDPAHPVTRGFLCGKVARYLDRVYSPQRLLYPMRRRPGVTKGPLAQGREAEAFERISWDQALDAIAAKLKAVAAEHGPEAILPYSYAGTIGQLGYGSMDRRFFHRLGASQLDRTICASAGGAALTSIYGVKMGTAPQDFAHSGLVLVWGSNVHGNNIHLWPFLEEARRGKDGKAGASRQAARLVVIDPYRTRTAALADEHLAIHPGTDAALALGMMHVMFRDGLHHAAYLDACVNDWQALREYALGAEFAPAAVTVHTGIGADVIERLAREYAQAGRNGRAPAAIRANYGIQRSEFGGDAMRAVLMLPLVTGSWTQQGGGALLSVSGSFPFQTQKLQMPELMEASPLGRAARTVNMNELGDWLTGSHKAPLEGPPVKALFVYNCNAAAVAPDANKVLAGLRRDDLFTVVHEQFFTDTTDYADIVLPATTFLEQKDVMGAYGHFFVQISDAAIAPLGEARSNVELFAALGRRMGFDEPAFAAAADELIAQALDSDDPKFAGITPETLAERKCIPLTLPVDADGRTLPFSDASWFRTASGKAEVLPLPRFQAPAESRAHATAAFPLEFLARKADNFMNSTFANLPAHQRMERRSERIVEMHPHDAAARGIRDGDAVAIWNERGRIRLRAVVAAEPDSRVAAGTVAARLDWHKLAGAADVANADNLAVGGRAARNVNALTSQRLTDIGGGATFYSVLVQVARDDDALAMAAD